MNLELKIYEIFSLKAKQKMIKLLKKYKNNKL